MTADPTVTLRFTRAILQAAEQRGIALPAGLEGRCPADGRTPLALQDELWEAFCAAARDPLIGLKLGLDLQVGHLDLVGMLLMSCETQGEALDLLLEYHPIVGEGGDFHLEHRGGDSLLIYEPRYSVRRRERVEAVMACVLNLTRWITGNHFQARAVELTETPPADTDRYEALLGTPVRFGRPANALVFDPELMAIPLIQANADLRDHLKTLADQALDALTPSGAAGQVRALLRESPHRGKEQVAEALGIGGRHLVRRLQEEGTSFKLLRATVLQQIAEEQLAHGETVARVAERLGFSDESAFAKAFKRWAGVTPARYRDTT